MNEMYSAIIELVREGGQAATYIVVAYYVIGLVKFVLGMGVIGYVVSKIYSLAKYAIDVDARPRN